MTREQAIEAALRLFLHASYPVAKSINPRGHNWSEAYLDSAKAEAESALSLPADDGWRSMDLAPRNGDYIIMAEADERDVYEGRWLTSPNGSRWFAFRYGRDVEINPVKWRPLPAPPEVTR